MPIGIKLKDGSVWTAISYDVVPEAVTKTTSETQLSDITDLTCVKWDKDLTHTHPYSACFIRCIWFNWLEVKNVVLTTPFIKEALKFLITNH